MAFTRRGFLAGSGAAFAALGACSHSGETGLMNWQAGYQNAPADGFAATEMTLIQGRLPEALRGSLYRNGPAQFQYGNDYLEHWFDGDGMVHRIAFGDGKAIHSGQFVETPKRRAEQAAQKFLAAGFGSIGDPDYPIMSSDDTNAANTSVLPVGDDLLALWEAGSATRLDPVTLETRGVKTWRDDLKGMPFLAHPKVSPDGTIWNLAVSGQRVGLYHISPKGALKGFHLVDMGAPAYIHDFSMTEKSILIFVQPWIYTRNLPPFTNSFSWEPERGLKVLIVDKADPQNQRWAELPAKFFFHTGDAWEDNAGTVYVDFCAYDDTSFVENGEQDVIRSKYDPSKTSSAQLVMARMPVSGETTLTEARTGAEFSRTDPRFQGKMRDQVWMIDTANRRHAPGAQIIKRMDWAKSDLERWDYGKNHIVEEHLFVPHPDSELEGDGWLIGTTLNMQEQATEVHVFNAIRLADGPLASFRAPYAWPLGFHGVWGKA